MLSLFVSTNDWDNSIIELECGTGPTAYWIFLFLLNGESYFETISFYILKVGLSVIN